MTQSCVQIVTAYANQSAAIALSTPLNGVPQSMFDAYATTNSNGISAQPSHCWTNGWMDDDIIALFVADPTKYTVTYFPNRQCFNALSTYTPTLYPWLGAA